MVIEYCNLTGGLLSFRYFCSAFSDVDILLLVTMNRSRTKTTPSLVHKIILRFEMFYTSWTCIVGRMSTSAVKFLI